MENQIKTYEEAAAKLGLDPTNLPGVYMLPEAHQKSVIAYAKLIIIAQALNDGWTPDWNDWDQWKYYPWFKVHADDAMLSGRGLSCDGCDGVSSDSCVGSRLCFKSRELAEYAGTQFKDLYEDYMLIKQ